eukprot:TRINITY_DN7663_c2_g1_i1.p1 TRINITY_DN7663_c2_g1~~TRINITY_DN7663_c2_g1_i1.p1  ORF type:complete len:140 (-),score=30.29 TRINITY_DN7663_c2_g1_i1:80-499(-)
MLMLKGGREEYSAMQDQYIRCGEGFLLCYDIKRKQSMQYLEDIYINRIQQVKDTENLNDTPLILCATKIDLDSGDQSYKQDLVACAEKYDIKWAATSSKENIGVSQVFSDMVKLIDVKGVHPSIDLKKNSRKSKKCMIL